MSRCPLTLAILLLLAALLCQKSAGADAAIDVKLPGAVLSGRAFTLCGTVSSPGAVERIVVTADGATAAERSFPPSRSVRLEDLKISIILSGEGRHNLSLAAYGQGAAPVRKTMVVAVKAQWGDPPAVKLLFPKEVPARTPLALKGTVSDDNGLWAVAVFLDGRAAGEKILDGRTALDLSECGISLTLPKPGSYTLLVRVVDSAPGEPRHYTDREVTLKAVSALGARPQVTLSMAKESVTGREFPVTGVVTDAEGVRRIECYLDGRMILNKDLDGVKSVRLEDIPWRLTVAEPGVHTLMVRAFDDPASGLEHATDVQVSFKVKQGAPMAPGVLVLPPSKVTQGVPFTLQGSIRYEGGLTGFDVFLDGKKVAERRFGGETSVDLGDFSIPLTVDEPGKKLLLVKAFGTDGSGKEVIGEGSVTFTAGKAKEGDAAGKAPPGGGAGKPPSSGGEAAAPRSEIAGKAARNDRARIVLDVPAKVSARTTLVLKGSVHDGQGIDKISLTVNGRKVTERGGLGRTDVDLGALGLQVPANAPGDYEVTVCAWRKGASSGPPSLEKTARFKAVANWGKAPWMIIYPQKDILEGKPCVFTGTARDDTGIVAILIYVDGREALRREFDYVREMDLAPLDLAVVIPHPGTHRIRFAVLDSEGPGGPHGSEVSFNVQVASLLGALPKVELERPPMVRAGRTFRLRGTVRDESGVNRLQVFIDGRLSLDRAVENLKEVKLDDPRFGLDAPSRGAHEIRVRAYDEYPTRFERYTDALQKLTVIE